MHARASHDLGMPLALAVIVTLICSAAADALACRWHQARELGAVGRGVLVGVALEAIQWVPALLAIDAIGDAAGMAAIVVASLAGSAIGSVWGFRRPEPVVHDCKTCAKLAG